jgi:hypothetical protein
VASPAGKRDSEQARDGRPGIRFAGSRRSFEAGVEGATALYSFKKLRSSRIEEIEQLGGNKGEEFLGCWHYLVLKDVRFRSVYSEYSIVHAPV